MAPSRDTGKSLYLRCIFITAVSLAVASCAPAPTELSGVVRARQYRLGSRLGGEVAELPVREGEEAARGATLACLDDSVLLARREVLVEGAKAAWANYEDLKAGATAEELRRARAELAAAEAQYEEALAGFRDEDIKAAVSSRNALRAKLDAAEKNAQRTQNLFDEGVLAANTLDAAIAERDSLRSQVASAQAQLDKLTRGLRPEQIDAAAAAAAARKAVLDRLVAGATGNQLAAAKARARQLDAQIAALELDIADLAVTAPTDGVVEEHLLDPGETASPGQAVVSFVSTQDVWIDTFVPGSRLGAVDIGAKLRVVLDAFRGKAFEAEVFFVSRQAEFTPRNVSTPEERVSQVYRVKLKPLAPPVELRAGMTGSVLVAP
jgi:multidrug resistance efflux pump